jgi:hypothetical protein
MRSLLLATVALTTASHVAAAQIFHSPETARTSRGGWSVDVGGRMAQPVGEFSDNVNRAWGGGVAVRYHFGWFPVLGVRADLGLLNYGSERKRVPLSPTLNRVLVEMNTSNNIALVTAGPELALRRGPVRPYLYGFGGYSHFYTESSARDQDGGHAIASSVNFSDGGGTVGWGGGVRIPFKARRATASFDAGTGREHICGPETSRTSRTDRCSSTSAVPAPTSGSFTWVRLSRPGAAVAEDLGIRRGSRSGSNRGGWSRSTPGAVKRSSFSGPSAPPAAEPQPRADSFRLQRRAGQATMRR